MKDIYKTKKYRNERNRNLANPENLTKIKVQTKGNGRVFPKEILTSVRNKENEL